MGYELRVERATPLDHGELARVLSAEASFELRGSAEAGEVVAWHGDSAHPVAVWSGRLVGTPVSDWHVAQLVRLSDLLGARLIGEDGESYSIRDGIVEQASGNLIYEFGKLEEIIDLGPIEWTA